MSLEKSWEEAKIPVGYWHDIIEIGLNAFDRNYQVYICTRDEWLAHSRRGPSKVINADLWARALDLVNEQAYHGCEVQFWLLARDQRMQIEDYARWLAKASDLPVPEAYKQLGNLGLTFMTG